MLAFVQEHGPWLIKDGSAHDAQMVKNDYSWNLEANILYIE
jgi:carboxypeptidase C (cathepsin A)